MKYDYIVLQEVRRGESGKDCEYGLMEMRGEYRGVREGGIVYSGYGEMERSESDTCWKLNMGMEGGWTSIQIRIN